MKTRFFIQSCLIAFSFMCIFGCIHNNIARSSTSAALGDILEPVVDSRSLVQKSPLTLPASVAIVFVPSRQHYGVPNTTLRVAAEQLKKQLMTHPKYVSAVSVVTGDDLAGKVSLEKIREIYVADIAIVLTYQQDQRNFQSGLAGLMDVTIVGAFLVPGVETKTYSIVDGKVIHIPNNAIIFRASGSDERSTYSTTHSEKGTATEESINSILAATTEFGKSLTTALSKFDNYDFSQAVPASVLTAGNSADAKGKPANDYWGKVDDHKTSGGGSFDIALVLISAVACVAAWRRQ